MSTLPPNPFQVLLAALQKGYKISLKAFKADTQQNLIFIILNDTYHLIPYDLGVLWTLSKVSPRMLGVSGQSTFTTQSEIAQRWKELLAGLKDPHEERVLTEKDFPLAQDLWNSARTHPHSSILWLPILTHEKETLGLWLEKWEDPAGTAFSDEHLKIVHDFLLPGYAAAWLKIAPRISFGKVREFFTKKRLAILLPVLLGALFLLHVPLRVVAACEVVAKDPTLITAPLNGIIAKVDVKPGQLVKVGDLLFQYDIRIPLQELKVAEKQVLMTHIEINQAAAASVEDHQTPLELAGLNIKLQKAELEYEFAKANYKDLVGKAPREGVALIDNPDEWQGKPVKIGEKILLISNPEATKVKIWIPENDNIQIALNKPIKVYLNNHPEKNYAVALTYISHEVTLSDKRIPSFVAEGEWIKPNEDVKLGVKGTAILYGENVPLFYYIFRKPLSTLRDFFGV